MLFPKRFWDGLADGSVTVAFRRWKRPTVRAGGTLQSPGGQLSIDEVTVIELDEITDVDVQAAGYERAADLVGDLRPEGVLHRVRFHRLGDDPRAALRARADLAPDELAALLAALARLPWAVPVLRLIAASPGVVSTELAPQLGLERLPFKQRVRRLKALGLTESLQVGYRISPRGQAVLGHID